MVNNSCKFNNNSNLSMANLVSFLELFMFNHWNLNGKVLNYIKYFKTDQFVKLL